MAVVMSCVWGGAGYYLVRDNVAGADVRGSHTIMVRAKWTTTTTNASYFAAVLCTSAVTSGGFIGRLASDPDGTNRTRGARFSTGGTYNKVSQAGSFGNTTTWYHLAMVYNAATQIVEYYVDGVSIGTIASTTGFVGTDTAGAFGCLATGKFADLALYNRALTAGEVLQMAQARALSVTSNCLGFYRMDTNSTGGTASGNATDTSGSGNTLNRTTAAGTPDFTYSTADNPPQPEYLYDIAATGSASTSGSAAVNKLLGACTGTTSTTGSAAVSLSNVVATGVPGRGVGGADVMPRNGAEGYRYPQSSGLNVSSNSGPSTGGVTQRTFMTWARYYGVNGSNASLSSGFTNFRGTGGTGWGLRFAITAFGTNQCVFTGTALSASTPVATLVSSAADLNWHHLCGTYDGTHYRFYVDGVQVGSDTAATVPTDDTATSVLNQNSAAGVITAVDMAHAKAWVGRALNTTEIAAEMASYRPVTDTPNVRGYWPMAWDNPRWDAWSNTITLGAIEHAGDNAPNGPSGSWPPVGSVAGSTTTRGSAQLNLVQAIVPTGATSTSGSATVSASAGIAATGTTSTSGAVNVVVGTNAAGATQTTGSAASGWTYARTAAGATSTTGAAAVSGAASAAASAQSSTSGAATSAWAFAQSAAGQSSTGASAATVTSAAGIVATGASSTAGSVPVITLVISATGETSSAGAAAVTASAALAATGGTTTVGAVNTAGTLPATGLSSTDGAASFDTASFPVIAAGSAATSGSAALDGGYPQVVTGETSTTGSAAMTAAAAVVATGATATAGAATFSLIVGGLSNTSGSASVASSAAVAATGVTTTTGAAVVQLVLIAGGQSTTSGSATMSATFQLAANGSCVTFGNAAFDGVSPVSGGAGGDQSYMRRMSALGAGRRRIR